VEQFAPEDIARYRFANLVYYTTSIFLKIMQPYHMNNFDLNIIGQDVSLTNQQRLALSFGLKFIPPCRPIDPLTRVDDVLLLGRRMLIRLIHGQSPPLPWYSTWKAGAASASIKFNRTLKAAQNKVAPELQSLVHQIAAATRLAAAHTQSTFTALYRTSLNKSYKV
jgi:hypothetical protein